MYSIFSFIAEYAFIFSIFNLVGGIILLLVGLTILLKKENNNKFAGIICTTLSILMFIGAMSNMFFSNIVFN